MYIAPYSDWLQSMHTFRDSMMSRMDTPEYAYHYARLMAHYALLLMNNVTVGVK